MTTPETSGDRKMTTPEASGDHQTTTPEAAGDRKMTTPEASGDRQTTTPEGSGDHQMTTPHASGGRHTTTPEAPGDWQTTTLDGLSQTAYCLVLAMNHNDHDRGSFSGMVIWSAFLMINIGQNCRLYHYLDTPLIVFNTVVSIWTVCVFLTTLF